MLEAMNALGKRYASPMWWKQGGKRYCWGLFRVVLEIVSWYKEENLRLLKLRCNLKIYGPLRMPVANYNSPGDRNQPKYI